MDNFIPYLIYKLPAIADDNPLQINTKEKGKVTSYKLQSKEELATTPLSLVIVEAITLQA